MINSLKVKRITENCISQFQTSISSFENSISYPFGNDRFYIDHGADYFAFFRRLGEVHYYAIFDHSKIVGVGAGILRNYPFSCWYLCDLKIQREYRGLGLPIWFLKEVFFLNYLKCPRGYGILMDKPNCKQNPIAKLLGRFSFASFEISTKLYIFNLNFAQMNLAKNVFIQDGKIPSYISLKGKKDLILLSTHKPIPLLHLQFNLNQKNQEVKNQVLADPQEKYNHMFCVARENIDLLSKLRDLNLKPTATATVLAHQMQNINWDFILTSDI